MNLKKWAIRQKPCKAHLFGSVEMGQLTSPIDREFPLDDAAAAVEYMTSNQHFGKIVFNADA